MTGPTAADADAWWDSLGPERKQQIARWVSGGHHGPPPEDPDLLDTLDRHLPAQDRGALA